MASSKQNIILHLDGINACESKEYEHALKLFMRISEPSAPIFFNIGCCYLRLRNNTEALKMFQECVSRDKYLAVGYFQLGVSQTLCGDLTSAADSFQAAFRALRGNPFIDYKQLNMSCKLYASEVNFNLGLAYLFTGYRDEAKECILIAGGLPTDSSRHSAIPGAVDAVERNRWTFFGNKASDKLVMLPENSLFRVSKAKMEGLQTSTKFMDKAKVVAAVNDDYSFVGFVGAKKLQQAANNANAATQPQKRNNPPVGPPPSVPPPRLPPSLANSGRSNTPSPTHNMAGNGSPKRRLSPSRPPPPTTAPPKSIPKGFQPKSPPPRDQSPIKTMSQSPPRTGVVSELRKNLDNTKFKVDDKPTKAPYTKVFKPKGRTTTTGSRTATLKCEFSIELNEEASYENIMAKLAEKMSQTASKLSNPLQRKSMVVTFDDLSSKRQVALTPGSASWQAAWLSAMKNRQYEPQLTLKENEKESSSASPTKRYPPTTVSPGYRPSRPAPAIGCNAENEQEDDIYHDIS